MVAIAFLDQLGVGGNLKPGDFEISGFRASGITAFGQSSVTRDDDGTYLIRQQLNGGEIAVIFAGDRVGSGTVYEIRQIIFYDGQREAVVDLGFLSVELDLAKPLSSDFFLPDLLSGSDWILGNRYDDRLSAGAGNDIVGGQRGNDSLWGGSGNDTLSGARGDDSLWGGSGADVLSGGSGRDILEGGSGRDAFMFFRISESGTAAATADVIRDFARGQDRIDLKAVDAFARSAANEAFVWKGTGAFTSTTAGEVSYRKVNNAGTSNDYTMVFLDNDGDRDAEMAIRLTGLHDLRASDFIL